MRTVVLVTLTALLASACNTTAGACRRYITEQNACSNELGDDTVLAPLTADVVCASLGLPGVATADSAAVYNCLADAYASADCSTSEAFSETFATDDCAE